MSPSSNPLLIYALKFFCLHKQTTYRPPDIVRIFFVLISSFASIIALEGTFKYGPVFTQHLAPIIVPSWAATIILTCNALESPLGQPLSLFFGTFFASVLGIGLTKLWILKDTHMETLWVCGAVALALSSIMMSHTKLVHPAAGSAALLAAINPEIRAMGWFYLVVQIVTALIVICVGSIFANIYSQYPLYWALPPKLSKVIPAPSLDKDDAVLTHTTHVLGTHSADSQTTHVDTSSAKMDTNYDNKSFTSVSDSRYTTPDDEKDIDTSLNINHSHTAAHGLATSVGNALTRVVSESRYLTRILSTTESTNRLSSKFPNVDLQSAALVSPNEFSFPASLTFTSEDRGILISIQRKLAALSVAQAEISST